MSWLDIRNAIVDVLGQCARIDVRWRDQHRPFVRATDSFEPDRGVQALLNIINVTSVMRDDTRQQYNATTNKIDLNQAGQRHFTVSCLVEAYDQSSGRFALEYTERIRDCLARTQVLEMLRANELTVREVTPTLDLSDIEDDHAVSKAQIDIMFSAGVNVTEGPGMESLDWIETVELDGDGPLDGIEGIIP